MAKLASETKHWRQKTENLFHSTREADAKRLQVSVTEFVFLKIITRKI